MLPPIPPWDGLHPLVVHFPVALLLTAPLFLLVGLFPWRHARSFAIAALAMVAIGTAGAWLAAATGDAASDKVARTPEIEAAIERHEELADITRASFTALTAIFAALLVAPRLLHRELGGKLQISLYSVFLVLYLAGTLVLVNTAHQGGRLVHELGVKAWTSQPGAAPAGAHGADDD